jgi:hypothetical protein
MKSESQIVDMLETICGLLIKYSARFYSGDVSPRLQGWMDEYNKAKHAYPVAWQAHCDKVRADPDHNGYDCL